MADNNESMDLFGEDLDFNLDLDSTSIPEEDIPTEDVDETDDVVDESNNSSEDTDKTDPESVTGEGDRSGEEDEESSPNFYSSLASALTEQGLLPSLDLETTKIESVDDFTSAFKQEVDNAVKNQLITKLGQEGYDAIDKGVTVQEFKSYENELATLNTINDDNLQEDLELSKKVVYQDLINQGLSEGRALKFLERTLELGEDKLIEDAKESLTNIKEFTVNKIDQQKLDSEKNILDQQKAEEKAIVALKENVYNTKELIEGITISKSIQDKVYKDMTEIVGNDPNGNPENKFMKDRRENTLDIDTKIYYLYNLTNGFKDFSKLSTKVKSNALSDLEKSFRQTSFKEQGNDPDFLKDSESYGAFGDEVVF